MATRNWNVGNGVWTTATNWLEGSVPVAGDTANIYRTVTAGTTVTASFNTATTLPAYINTALQTANSGRLGIGATGQVGNLSSDLVVNVANVGTSYSQLIWYSRVDGAFVFYKRGNGGMTANVPSAGQWQINRVVIEEGPLLSGVDAASTDFLKSSATLEFGNLSYAPSTPPSYDTRQGAARTLDFNVKFVRSSILVCTTDTGSNGAKGTVTAQVTTFANSVEFAGTSSATSNLTLTLDSPFTFSGALLGTGGFTKAGTATLTLSGGSVGTWTGQFDTSNGNITLAAAAYKATLNRSNSAGSFTFPSSGMSLGNIIGSGSLNTGASTFSTGDANVAAAYSGALTGSGQIVKFGTAAWTISGNNSAFTGGFRVSAGTLIASTSASVLGAAANGATVVDSGATLQVAALISKSGQPLTFSGSGVGSVGAVRAVSGTQSYTASNFVLGANNTRIAVDAGTLTLTSAGAMTGTGFTLLKEGAGELALNFAGATSSYGSLTVNSGTVTINADIAATGNSLLGTGTPVLSGAGATLKSSSASAVALNRSVTLTSDSPAFESASTGAFTVTAISYSGANAKALTFKGTNTAANTFSGALADNGAATVSVVKSGAGSWTLSGALTYTGTTSISAGTLSLGAADRTLTGGVAISGGTLAMGNNSNTITAAVTMTGGTVTGTLASTTTVSVTSGTGKLSPAAGGNTYTGATSISLGATLDVVTTANPSTAGAGKVTGDSNVTVTGSLRTGGGGTQTGKARYGGDLAFAANSNLYVGHA